MTQENEKKYFINSFGEKMELEDSLNLDNIKQKAEDRRDYFLSVVYEWGNSETIFHIGLKKFVNRDSLDGREAEEIQAERAFRTWNKKIKYDQ